MLKVLLLLAVLVGVLLWWKHSQRGRQSPPAPRPAEPASPEAMLRCSECGLHLPASQVLPGRGGVFCSHEHRQQFEDRG
ncbi:MAG: PP0621 family protein [Inhella sp.]